MTTNILNDLFKPIQHIDQASLKIFFDHFRDDMVHRFGQERLQFNFSLKKDEYDLSLYGTFSDLHKALFLIVHSSLSRVSEKEAIDFVVTLDDGFLTLRCYDDGAQIDRATCAFVNHTAYNGDNIDLDQCIVKAYHLIQNLKGELLIETSRFSGSLVTISLPTS